MPARRSLAALLVLLAPLSVAFADESDRIVDALGLQPGMSAADVGAGEGRFTAALARHVGPAGHVWATEVESAKLETIQRKMKDDGIGNVRTVLGDQATTGLPAGCCDAILVRMVYHHFTDPAAMRKSLWSALRPGGRVVVIDVPPHASWRKLEGVPERGGHGIPQKELVADMRGGGFSVVAEHGDWPGEDDSYCVVFQRPTASRTVPASSAPTASSAGTGDSRNTPATTSSTR